MNFKRRAELYNRIDNVVCEFITECDLKGDETTEVVLERLFAWAYSGALMEMRENGMNV